ncbi:fluoride efflux transporter CrcB [Zavarzinia sp.]|uniref:fluoride efflux transporter CrcB n=1 Tax=Zavarzinia sp. TaxID=2027920 RepID=UPI00356485F6
MQSYVFVALGGAIGSMLRLGTARLAQVLFGAGFPAGTLAVNLVGSAVMGLLAALLAERSGDDPLRLFLMTGILGGFTTFSAFSLDAYSLWARGEGLVAVTYVAVSVVVALAGLVAGLMLGRHVMGA